MNTRLIACFAAAAEHESFTEAAKALYTDQPNLSKQIAALEREVGTRLFYREHRSVRLTAAGQRFYELVKDIPARLDEAIVQARQAQEREDRYLRIGVLEGHQLSPEVMHKIGAFNRAHPGHIQTISRCEFDELLRGLEDHAFDVVFTILFTVGRRPGVRTRVLYRQSTFVAVNRKDPLAEEESLTWAQIRGEPFLLLEERLSPRSFRDLGRYLKKAGVAAEQVRIVDSTEALFTSVEIGLGIAVVDEINRLQSSPYVRLIPLKEDTLTPDFGVAWLENDHKKQLGEFLSSLFGPDEREG